MSLTEQEYENCEELMWEMVRTRSHSRHFKNESLPGEEICAVCFEFLDVRNKLVCGQSF